MGSFRMQGFISNIPIREHDRTVAFICVNTSKVDRYRGAGLIYPLDMDLVPVCGAIHGEYNDYGSICEIDESPTVTALESISGMEMEKLLGLMAQYRRKSIRSMADTKDVYEDEIQYREFLKKFFGRIKHSKKYEDYTIEILLEREEFYEYMTRSNYVKFHGYDYTADEVYDMLLDIKEKHPLIFGDKSIFDVGRSECLSDAIMDMTKNGNYEDYRKEFDGIREAIDERSLGRFDFANQNNEDIQKPLYLLYCIYPELFDWKAVKEDILSILRFNTELYFNQLYYRPSVYGSQGSDYDSLIGINKKILEILVDDSKKENDDSDEDLN